MRESDNSLLEQILGDNHFRDWALGLAPEYDEYWRNWRTLSNVHEITLQKGMEILKDLNDESPAFSDEYIAQKVGEAIAIAQAKEQQGSDKQFYQIFRKFRHLAASVIFLSGLAGIFIKYYSPENAVERHSQNSTEHPAENQYTVINNFTIPSHLILPDGSSVILQPQSEISYPTQFSDHHRDVILRGDAFFEVVKNPNSPFTVIAGNIRTKVLGTSFRIATKQGSSQVLVSVKSGKVAVYTDVNSSDSNDAEPKTVLHHNQQALFLNNEIELPQEIETGSPSVFPDFPIETISFVYDSAPVVKVIEDLEAAYGVDIQFNQEDLTNCSITAQLEDEPLQQKLKWICTILEATCTIENNQIIIHSKPCKP